MSTCSELMYIQCRGDGHWLHGVGEVSATDPLSRNNGVSVLVFSCVELAAATPSHIKPRHARTKSAEFPYNRPANHVYPCRPGGDRIAVALAA